MAPKNTLKGRHD